MKLAIKEAKQNRYDSLWLSVWEKNSRAVSFYKKWGFSQVGNAVFPVGDDVQQDFIMELPVK